MRLRRRQLHEMMDYIREQMFLGFTEEEIYLKIKNDGRPDLNKRTFESWVTKLMARDTASMIRNSDNRLAVQIAITEERMQKHYKMAELMARTAEDDSVRLNALRTMHQISIDQVKSAATGVAAVDEKTRLLITNDRILPTIHNEIKPKELKFLDSTS